MTWGMASIPYRRARSGFSSVFTLPTLTRPANCAAILSMVGASIRQGPHQAAQKSTSTSCSLLTTSWSQFAVVNSLTFSLAMILLPFLDGSHLSQQGTRTAPAFLIIGTLARSRQHGCQCARLRPGPMLHSLGCASITNAIGWTLG